MPDPTNADRQRRWRDRQAGRSAPAQRLPCASCTTIHTGIHGTLCRKCWLKTQPGKEWQRLRMAAYRKRQSQLTDLST